MGSFFEDIKIIQNTFMDSDYTINIDEINEKRKTELSILGESGVDPHPEQAGPLEK